MAVTPVADDQDERARVAGMGDPVVRVATRLAEAGGFAARIDHRLERAGMPIRAGEFVMVSIGAAMGGAVAGWFIASNVLVAAAAAVVAGFAIPYLVVARKLSKRVGALHDQLPDILSILASSLRAGHSFFQGLDMVAQEVGDPASTEFGRVLAEVRLGRPIEEALAGMADRIDSEDFRWAFLAVNVQREIGGNLAEILDTVAETVRDRDMVRRQIKVLSSEGRLSIAILAALPFLIAAWIAKTNPGYLALLFTNRLGMIMVGTAAILMAVGIAWMRRIVKIDV
jgi:tight adherence protein B